VHLDNVGAEVGEQHPGDGAGHAAGQVKHADAGERVPFFSFFG
jgi:hypothetical protein